MTRDMAIFLIGWVLIILGSYQIAGFPVAMIAGGLAFVTMSLHFDFEEEEK